MRSPLFRITKISFFIIVIALVSFATILRNPVWESRLSLWKNVVKRSPVKVRGHYNLGNAFAVLNMQDDAIREYLDALKIESSFFHGNVHSALGIAYVRKGLLDEAFNEFQTALTLAPSSAKPHYGLGIIYENRGNLDGAIKEYKTAIELEPSYEEPYAALGVAYGKKDMLIEARDALKTAVNLKSEIAYPHYNLARTLDRLGDYKNAVIHYREFLNLVPRGDESFAVQISKRRILELEGYRQNF